MVEKPRPTLEQLVGRAQQLKNNIARARFIVNAIGTNDSELTTRYPSAQRFQLDPANMQEFQARRPRAAAINRRLLKVISRQEQEYEETTVQVSKRVTEEEGLEVILGDVVLVDEEIQTIQADVDTGVLSPKIRESLVNRALELQGILFLNAKGMTILAERAKTEKETAPAKEPEPQPTRFVINEETKEIIADDNGLTIHQPYLRDVLIELARDATKPGKGILKRVLNRLAKELGAKGNDPSNHYIPNLNRILGSQTLTAAVMQSGNGLATRIRLIHATVEFAPKAGSPPAPFAKPSPEGEVVTSTKLRLNKITGRGSGNNKDDRQEEIEFSPAQLAVLVELHRSGYHTTQKDLTRTTSTTSEIKHSPVSNAIRQINDKFRTRHFEAHIKREGNPGPGCIYVGEHMLIEWVEANGSKPRGVERTVLYDKFPNGQRLLLDPREALAMDLLTFYPNEGTLTVDGMMESNLGEQLVASGMNGSEARRYITKTLIDRIQYWVIKASVIVANETPLAPTGTGAHRKAQYFGIAVNSMAPITTMERAVVDVVFALHKGHQGNLTMQDMNREIYQSPHLTEEERTAHTVLFAKQLMALWGSAYVKMLHGAEPNLWDQIKETHEGTGTRGAVRFLYKVLAEIAIAQMYFENQGRPRKLIWEQS